MSTLPSPQTVTISTFGSPRVAPRPRVIPLFATTLCRRHRRTIGIHTPLPIKALYHPRRKRAATPTPLDASSFTAGSSDSPTMPSSPLTPMDDEFPNDACAQVEPQSILIPPPLGTLSMASLNLHHSLIKDYRVSCGFLSFCIHILKHEFRL